MHVWVVAGEQHCAGAANGQGIKVIKEGMWLKNPIPASGIGMQISYYPKERRDAAGDEQEKTRPLEIPRQVTTDE
jgi:hypothetical protein